MNKTRSWQVTKQLAEMRELIESANRLAGGMPSARTRRSVNKKDLITKQVREMRMLANGGVNPNSPVSFRIHYPSITGVLEKYLTEKCQRRERWAGQKVTREELEEYIREQRRKEGAA